METGLDKRYSKIIKILPKSDNVIVFASGALIDAGTSERFKLSSWAGFLYEIGNIDIF